MLLGVILFFDGALLALGNVCLFEYCMYGSLTRQSQVLFLSGLTLIIGPQKTFYFFARRQKLRGTVCFLGGIVLVFFRWPFVGVCVETFGFLNLFGCVREALRRLQLLTHAKRFLPGDSHVPKESVCARSSIALIASFQAITCRGHSPCIALRPNGEFNEQTRSAG